MPGCSAQSGFDCNCTFARMNFNDMCALDAAAHFGLEGSATIPVIQFKLSERKNKVLSNVSSFCGLVTAGNRAGATSLPKPTSALRMMTNGNDVCFWGPNGIISKFLASTRAAVVELRALVARQAAAILRLLNHLANPGGGAGAIAAPGAPAPALAPSAANNNTIALLTSSTKARSLRPSAATEPQPPPPLSAPAPRLPPAVPPVTAAYLPFPLLLIFILRAPRSLSMPWL